MSDDVKWMKSALALARRGLGNVAPNPAVGCLIVKGGVLVGRGWTQPYGRPHAETEALKQAGDKADGATVYVTLEPCAHHGKTPPCADALVKAGVARVVIAVGDVDKRVAGKGIDILQNGGIEVTRGVLEEAAAALNAGFFLSLGDRRPSFTLKIAATLDGKIATASGESKWITGEGARRYGHMLRANHDAILIGVNTVLADDPELTCRLAGLRYRSPVRVILDSTLKSPPSAKVFREQDTFQTYVVCNDSMQKSAVGETLKKTGVKLLYVQDTQDLKAVAVCLANEGLTRVLVEGGGTVHASFLRHRMCDVLHTFVAAKTIGGEGIGAIGNLSLAHLADAPHLKLVSSRKIGTDLLATYRNAG